MSEDNSNKIRLGRMSYLNVLPIYYPLEKGIIKNSLQPVYGTPARLNKLMSEGQLEISSTSSIEYARNYSNYYLLSNLAIGSCGPVQSVLLLSQMPVNKLEGQSVLLSAQTHTSATLLKILFKKYYQVRVIYQTGDITNMLEKEEFSTAFLAIGDEALIYRNHPQYPYVYDLGQIWMNWTGLPFIFGVWVVQKKAVSRKSEKILKGCHQLLAAKDWGKSNLNFFADKIEKQGILTRTELISYFNGLVYDLGTREKEGLNHFFEYLNLEGFISSLPPLRFYPNADDV